MLYNKRTMKNGEELIADIYIYRGTMKINWGRNSSEDAHKRCS